MRVVICFEAWRYVNPKRVLISVVVIVVSIFMPFLDIYWRWGTIKGPAGCGEAVKRLD